MTQNWSQIYNLIKFFFEFWLGQVAQNWESNWNLIRFFFSVSPIIIIYRLIHLTQKLKKLRLDGTHDTKLNFNWNPIFTLN